MISRTRCCAAQSFAVPAMLSISRLLHRREVCKMAAVSSRLHHLSSLISRNMGRTTCRLQDEMRRRARLPARAARRGRGLECRVAGLYAEETAPGEAEVALEAYFSVIMNAANSPPKRAALPDMPAKHNWLSALFISAPMSLPLISAVIFRLDESGYPRNFRYKLIKSVVAAPFRPRGRRDASAMKLPAVVIASHSVRRTAVMLSRAREEDIGEMQSLDYADFEPQCSGCLMICFDASGESRDDTDAMPRFSRYRWAGSFA